MIVKNEALTVERTIQSVREYVDEVVVGLDTESNDGTEEIVRRLADRIIDINLSKELAKKGPLERNTEWGFAYARNVTLGQCKKGNWRLILDGHEAILNPELMAEKIEDAKSTSCDGIEITVNFEPDDNGIPQMSFGSTRLVGPGVLYRNSIHNVPAVAATYQAHGILVEHRKQDQAIEDKKARDVQRADANIEGFRKKLRIEGDDSRSWYYLATAYKESARHTEAVKAFEECLKFSKWNEERWHARVNMGTSLLHLGERNGARSQFAQALEEFPPMAEAYYYLGDMAYKEQRYREAQVWLEKCIELEQPDCKLFVDPRVYLVGRYDLLSMVYNHLGQFGKAIEQAEKALRSAPNERIEKNVRIWREQLSKHGGAYYDQIWSKDKPLSVLEGQRMRAMASALGDVRRVLDVGSGPGSMIDFLPDETKYMGIDISAVARDSVIDRGGQALESLDELNGESFEGCILGEILEHLEDDVGILQQIKQHLVAGATVVASVPRYCAMRDPAHARDYTEQEFKQLMSKVGEAQMLEPIGPWMLCKSTVPEEKE